jgi:hypothetical protein
MISARPNAREQDSESLGNSGGNSGGKFRGHNTDFGIEFQGHNTDFGLAGDRTYTGRSFRVNLQIPGEVRRRIRMSRLETNNGKQIMGRETKNGTFVQRSHYDSAKSPGEFF